MGKTTDFFKKIRAVKGIFHAKMGSIKDRNGMKLTETKYIMNALPLLIIREEVNDLPRTIRAPFKVPL